MRARTAFKRLMDLPGVTVSDVDFQRTRVVVTVRLSARRLRFPKYGFATRTRYDSRPVSPVFHLANHASSTGNTPSEQAALGRSLHTRPTRDNRRDTAGHGLVRRTRLGSNGAEATPKGRCGQRPPTIRLINACVSGILSSCRLTIRRSSEEPRSTTDAADRLTLRRQLNRAERVLNRYDA